MSGTGVSTIKGTTESIVESATIQARNYEPEIFNPEELLWEIGRKRGGRGRRVSREREEDDGGRRRLSPRVEADQAPPPPAPAPPPAEPAQEASIPIAVEPVVLPVAFPNPGTQ